MSTSIVLFRPKKFSWKQLISVLLEDYHAVKKYVNQKWDEIKSLAPHLSKRTVIVAMLTVIAFGWGAATAVTAPMLAAYLGDTLAARALQPIFTGILYALSFNINTKTWGMDDRPSVSQEEINNMRSTIDGMLVQLLALQTRLLTRN
ncbi:hypothetical protein BGZ73_005611 [Actinomortierella ambigua]|nr:hypothetical protein BGZ73_005611 [Actinomortierella ambigua]